MNKILNRIYRIDNHPVSLLDNIYGIKYVSGLGACLFVLSNNSPIARMMYIAWANSILKYSVAPSVFWREDTDAIKKAISLQRKGFKFFSMKKHFFFDVLYLLESSLQDKYNPNDIVIYLQKNICGIFTKSALYKAVSAMYNMDKGDVDSVLLSHRQRNLQYAKSSEKKLIVVANVSAGKSTLINAMVGHRLNITRTTACTNKLVYIHNKRGADGMTIRKETGEYEYYDDISAVDSSEFTSAALPFNSILSQSSICIIDTPGINNTLDLNHRRITENTIKTNDYDVMVYVSNCQYFGTKDEHNMLSFIKKHVRKPVIFVLNQLDCFRTKEDSITKMLNDYKTDLTKIGFDNPVVVPVSAQAAILSRLDDGCLDEDDLYEKEILKKRFKKDYYDLPSYITSQNNTDFTERTGINLLENSIQNLIKHNTK